VQCGAICYLLLFPVKRVKLVITIIFNLLLLLCS